VKMFLLANHESKGPRAPCKLESWPSWGM